MTVKTPRQQPAYRNAQNDARTARGAASRHPAWRRSLTPLAQALSLAMLLGGVAADTSTAHAASNWFAAGQQAGAAARSQQRGPMPGMAMPSSVRQQMEARQQLTRSIANLNRTANAIAAQQASQEAARAMAAQLPSGVPNGLAAGGLEAATGAKAGWVGADKAVASADGRHVTIKQTAERAILNWETFNVGRNTTLTFQQNATDAVLNKVVGASTAPSQIHGKIQAAGTVMVVNQNGVVFSGTSQVDVRNLVAAAAKPDAELDAQFLARGIYSNGTTPTFKEALGNIDVQAGARITTATPSVSTSGGGYVLLTGKQVSNAGQISTPNGQALLAAGDSFVIARGQDTESNPTSTTRGNLVTAQFAAGSTAGQVSNTGLIQAAMGDITLAGTQVNQAGVVLASTSVHSRGTVHLKAADGVNGAQSGQVVLAEGATTAVLVDASNATALDSQRAGLLAPAVVPEGSSILRSDDRRDLSRVEISSTGNVDVQGGSMTLATGGQIVVDAAKRTLVRDGATLDVSGAVGVAVAMESNSLKINIQGNEQRDAPVNRDGGKLNSTDVWIDVRDLVFVPAGTNGYTTDRWYTAGGLLEVGGYLGTQNRHASEWLASGGIVRVSGGELVTQAGSQINLSGGSLDVQDGQIRQSWLRGADGRLYEVSKAPGDMAYEGLYRGYERVSERWGVTQRYYDAMMAPTSRKEGGYTVGRDAGLLVVSTGSAVLEGEIVSDTYQGARQTQAAQAGLDGFLQSQMAAARGAQLVVGSYIPYYVVSGNRLIYAQGTNANTIQEVVLGNAAEQIAAGLALDGVLPEDRKGRLLLDASKLNGLGALRIAAGDIVVDSATQVANGGEITLVGPRVDVRADLIAHAGSIQLGNVLNQYGASARVEDVSFDPAAGDDAWMRVADGVKLDASGITSSWEDGHWPGNSLPYLNGGAITVRSNRDVDLGTGTVIDVTSGVQWLGRDDVRGGKGGDVTLAANVWNGDGTGTLTFGGVIRGHGANGGGTLTVESGKVVIGDALPVNEAGEPLANTMFWRATDFNLGFADYVLVGHQGLSVADGAQLDVLMPLLRDAQGQLPNEATALSPWLPLAYTEDPKKAVLSTRQGANLTLHAGSERTTEAQRDAVALTVGTGARITVDPRSTIALASAGNLAVDGTLRAAGGEIALRELREAANGETLFDGVAHDRSMRVGSAAVLDVSGQAWSAVDQRGLRYGRADAGGKIVIGAELDDARTHSEAPDLFVVVASGAQLLANGASTVVDVQNRGGVTVASQGGTIALASNNGLVLDGTMRAASGGAGAAGGHLKVALEAPRYIDRTAEDSLRTPRELVLGHGPAQAAGEPQQSRARLDVDKIAEGGFDNASLLAGSFIAFEGDVSLNLGQSLALYAGSLVLADTASDTASDTARVTLAAPYVRLGGAAYAPQGDFNVRPTLNASSSANEGTGDKSNAVLDVQADLIDLRDRLTLGAQGGIRQRDGSTSSVLRRGFGVANLSSTADIRLLAHAPLADQEVSAWATSTRLLSGGDVNLVAAQIYPTVGAKALVAAGQDATLSIARASATVPETPHSAFGELTLQAGTIAQGGIVRAPLGLVTLSATGGSGVRLLSGSITSASGLGLSMPYGGTTDGLSYQYGGEDVTLVGAGGTLSQSLKTGVALLGDGVFVEAGALIDLSGGGDLRGAGFVTGRGGSTDARYHPLVRQGNDGFSLPSLADHPVYAIVPGVQQAVAPVTADAVASDPMVGQQITLSQGVPSLPAGTYTLLPSTYALMPGAFRVELDAMSAKAAGTQAVALRNGSWSTSGKLSVAGTGVADALSRPVLLTAADTVRKLSQYNEMSYADFVRADAALKGVPRAMLEADARALALTLAAAKSPEETFSFEGNVNFVPAEGGLGGSVGVFSRAFSMEVVADGRGATAGFTGTSVNDADLSALRAPRLSFGVLPEILYGQGGNVVSFKPSGLSDIYLRDGATLRAAEVLMLSSRVAGRVQIESGAAINTIGMGLAPYDSRSGFIYDPTVNSLLAVSNGWLDVLPAVGDSAGGPSAVLIGSCNATPCGTATLYSEGTLTVATDNAFELGEGTRFGARKLALAVGAINVGNTAALEDAATRGLLSSGLTLNQSVLSRLLSGDSGEGVPALEELSLTARDAINFYGDVTLSTLDASGQSSMARLALGAPALYGAGAAGERALIQTRELIWLGNTLAPVAPVAGGAGTGAGTLGIEVERLVLGHGPNSQPDNLATSDRLALGFADVNIHASQEVTANGKGRLSVYQRRTGYAEGQGATYEGGRLTVTTPLWTGEAGSVNTVRAGEITYIGLPGAAVPSNEDQPLGATLTLEGQRVHVNGLVRLPTGKLTLKAEGDVRVDAGARLDLAGRVLQLNDVLQATGGGDVILESAQGNITQHADAVIDLSARGNSAGSLKAVALGDTAGRVDLQGQILGGTEGYYDAGGTFVPHAFGRVEIRAQDLGDFAALNARLNRDQVFGARSFQIKRGDLVIGDELRANQVEVSVDGGSLTVNGRIDASGERVGSIRLASAQNLTVAGTAQLDTHGTVLRVDSYGAIIDSPNRAIVELATREGTLTLADGARIDLRHGTEDTSGRNDGRQRGTLTLNAPRAGATTGDIALDASGMLDIQGARDIIVLGTQRYTDATPGTGLNADGNAYHTINQAYLDAKHADSTAFINAALGNATLMNGKLAGLNNDRYRDAFHLRPGVEIVTPGDLAVVGDVDLSAYRYASVNPRTQLTSVYGSGESGNLVLRAGGSLDVFGSVTDGFEAPDFATGQTRMDGKGWILLPGVQPFGNDVVIPKEGVILAEGTVYQTGQKLNFAVPYAAFTLPAGVEMPAAMTLGSALTLPAGTQLQADIHGADGTLLFAAGTRLSEAATLPTGSKLGAGMRLAVAVPLQGGMWPAGVALPATLTQRGALTLAMGAYLPAGVNVKLPEGTDVVDLRTPDAAGQQGRNWALATLLPEGTQSWSMRLVAGADQAAADTRLTNPDAVNATLRLADAHYIAGREITGGGGVPVLSHYVWTSVPGGIRIPGEIVPKNQEARCRVSPTWCTAVMTEPPPPTTVFTPTTQLFSVLRTGAGDLELLSGGNFRMDSLYGVYTAGAQSASLATDGTDPYQQPRGHLGTGNTVLGSQGGDYEALTAPLSAGGAYAAWYPEQGGNLLLAASGDLMGNIQSNKANTFQTTRQQRASSDVGNWLWRQGTGARTDGQAETPTAWWINFGSYALPADSRQSGAAPFLVGFTGIGTLGGGNVDVRVDGDAGLVYGYGNAGSDIERSQGLVLGIGGTGRVTADGKLVQTGGGDLSLRVGGGINASSAAVERASQQVDLFGTVINLRGALQAQTGAIGEIGLQFGSHASQHNVSESRAYQTYVATTSLARGGLIVVPGDAGVRLDARGDLVLQGVGDAGRVAMMNTSPYVDCTGLMRAGNGASQFSLWTPHTAMDLFSAGGNLTPIIAAANQPSLNLPWADGRYTYPSILRAVAAHGSLYYGGAAGGRNNAAIDTSLVLAPSATGMLTLIAGESIQAAGYAVTRSGADPDSVATPLRPAFVGYDGLDGFVQYSNHGAEVSHSLVNFPLFAFGIDRYSAAWRGASEPVRFYAMNGDIVGLRTGEILTFPNRTLYQGSGPVRVIAGRDIVNAGTPLGTGGQVSNSVFVNAGTQGVSTGNLFIHTQDTDVSVIEAGRDIRLSSFHVAGPGHMSLVAGRNVYASGPGAADVYQEVNYTSIGAADANVPLARGASISIVAGAGANGPDYAALMARYLDPANRLPDGAALASQPNGAVKTYEGRLTLAQWLRDEHGYTGRDEQADAEAYLADIQAKRDADATQPRRVYAQDYALTSQTYLVNWLETRYGYAGAEAGAVQALQALAPEQQALYARQLYFTELREGGREYNDPASPRYGSYLRGREAIATLFPAVSQAGTPIVYEGGVTMYGGAGLQTLAGGDIQVLTPGGQQIYGVEGAAPPATAGVLTQGEGNIQLYSLGSILLGQSRIMTTFGGHIQAWAAEGDINAGRGSRTTVVYTPPRRVYDAVGNVTLSAQVPSTGAGIGTLAPIAEVPAGDVDLIAPLGTIDAGEAGIRVSGNVNIAALQVVNAANIQVQGDSAGIPAVAAVNVGALTNASAAASSAADAAQESVARSRAAARQNLPSIISVQILGFGDEAAEGGASGQPRRPQQGASAPVTQAAYDPAGIVEVLGQAPSQAQLARLTPAERRALAE